MFSSLLESLIELMEGNSIDKIKKKFHKQVRRGKIFEDSWLFPDGSSVEVDQEDTHYRMADRAGTDSNSLFIDGSIRFSLSGRINW